MSIISHMPPPTTQPTYQELYRFFIKHRKVVDSNRESAKQNYRNKFQITPDLSDEEKQIRQEKLNARNARRRELYAKNREERRKITLANQPKTKEELLNKIIPLDSDTDSSS